MEFNIDEYLEKKGCEKIIYKNKHEKQDPAIQKWWNNLFKELEEKHSLPEYKKRHHLEKIFSKDTLADLEAIGIEIHDIVQEDFSLKRDTCIDTTKQKFLTSLGITGPVAIPKKGEVTNPYLNFIKKSKIDAQIWRPRQKVSLEELSLMEKAENVTENIAEEFEAWFNGMGGKRKSEINANVILELFEMVFNNPAATSLCVRIKELGCVSSEIANAVHRPKLSESATIRHHIYKDLASSKQKPHMVAFGKTLPLSLRRKPVTENVKDKWLKCNVYHDELATMEGVWGGITELQSTRSFCMWLLDNPDITPPPFLVSCGLMDKRTLEQPVISAYQLVNVEASSTYFGPTVSKFVLEKNANLHV